MSDPEETGGSARVWLDATRTMVGLAMARSIGDLAVKRVSGTLVLACLSRESLAPYCAFFERAGCMRVNCALAPQALIRGVTSSFKFLLSHSHCISVQRTG